MLLWCEKFKLHSNLYLCLRNLNNSTKKNYSITFMNLLLQAYNFKKCLSIEAEGSMLNQAQKVQACDATNDAM